MSISTKSATQDNEQVRESTKPYRLSRAARSRYVCEFPQTKLSGSLRYDKVRAAKYLEGLSTVDEKCDFYFYLMVERRIGPDDIGSDLTQVIQGIRPGHAEDCKARLKWILSRTHGE